MVADLFSLLAQTAFPKGEAEKKANCAECFYREENRERNERQPWRWKGQSGERLVRRLEQTSSVCLRRQLPRRGKPRKGALRRALLQRGKPRKERKSAEALEKAKRGKGWCGGWGRPLQSACADSFPEGEAEIRRIAQSASTERKAGKGRIVQSTSTERKAEKGTKVSRGVGTGKAGKRLVRRLVADLFSLLAQTASPKGKPRKGELRRQLPRRGKPKKGELRRALLQRGKPRKERKTAVALDRAKPREQERFRGVRA